MEEIQEKMCLVSLVFPDKDILMAFQATMGL